MSKNSKLDKIMAKVGPIPVCLSCGRCVLVGKCCDKLVPVVDYSAYTAADKRADSLAKRVAALEEAIRQAPHTSNCKANTFGPDHCHCWKSDILACHKCGGTKGGTPGNEDIVDGQLVCDYCVAAEKHDSGTGLGP